jgi:ABC-type hemin transport system ATPase subunit
MGEPGWGHAQSPASEYIGCRGERREVKHLSTDRKRYSVSSGERKRMRPNRVCVKLSGVAHAGLWDLLEESDNSSASKKAVS